MQPRQQFVENARALRLLEAGMQRRELDRHRVGRLDGPDGALVRTHVIRGILGGARGLAEHVEREAIRPALRTARHGFLDGLGEHELPGEDAHRLAYRGAYERLAQPSSQTL